MHLCIERPLHPLLLPGLSDSVARLKGTRINASGPEKERGSEGARERERRERGERLPARLWFLNAMLEGVRFSIPSTSRIRCSRVSPALLFAPFIVRNSHTLPVLHAIAPPEGPLSNSPSCTYGPLFPYKCLDCLLPALIRAAFCLAQRRGCFQQIPHRLLFSVLFLFVPGRGQSGREPAAPPLSQSTGLNLVQVETALPTAPPPPPAPVPPSSAEASPAAIRPVTASRR